MKLTPQTLTEAGYTLEVAFNHEELIEFLQPYMKARSWPVFVYNGVMAVALAVLIALAVYDYAQGTHSFGTLLAYTGYGVTLAFLSIPVHEYLHVLAYRYVGAEQTSYGVNWRKFYFMALAHEFVASREAFRIVALTPFGVLTLLALLGVVLAWSSAWVYTAVGFILIHTAFCGGDFALLSYFATHSHLDIVTYDDVTNNTSYFYSKPVD